MQFLVETGSTGTTYDMYEHNISSANTSTSGASNLYDSTFYFVTSDYRVYKVLDNNGGTAYDGAEPTSTSHHLLNLVDMLLNICTYSTTRHWKICNNRLYSSCNRSVQYLQLH